MQTIAYPISVGVVGTPPRAKSDSRAEVDARNMAGRVQDCVEIDGSFARLPRAEQVAAWQSGAPATSRFLLTAPRALTHGKRLQNCDRELNALRACANLFGPSLAGIVFRLPTSQPTPARQLQHFLQQKPDQIPWLFVVPEDLPEIAECRQALDAASAAVACNYDADIPGRHVPKLAYWRIIELPASQRFSVTRKLAARALTWQRQGARIFIQFGGDRARRDAARVCHLLAQPDTSMP